MQKKTNVQFRNLFFIFIKHNFYACDNNVIGTNCDLGLLDYGPCSVPLLMVEVWDAVCVQNFRRTYICHV